MRLFIYFPVLFLGINSCGRQINEESNSMVEAIVESQSDTLFPAILPIEVDFPINFDSLTLDESDLKLPLAPKKEKFLQREIARYFAQLDPDHELFRTKTILESTLFLKYRSCLYVENENISYYLLLLEHPITGDFQADLVFYDRKEKNFFPTTFLINLWVDYEWQNDGFQKGRLRGLFDINEPILGTLDYNKDGATDVQIKRIVHNGTYNGLRTTILDLSTGNVDTLSVTEQALDYW